MISALLAVMLRLLYTKLIKGLDFHSSEDYRRALPTRSVCIHDHKGSMKGATSKILDKMQCLDFLDEF